MDDNVFSRFFNQGNRLSPIQVDQEGIFQDSASYEYKYIYTDSKKMYYYGKKNSCWTKRTPREFIKYFKKKGIEITIFNKRRRLNKDYEEENKNGKRI
jgi:hypothetical protein